MTERNEQRRALRSRIEAREALLAPGVFDMISARVADAENFGALYMTGYGVSASYLGLPDAGLATYSDMVACLQRMADTCRTPVIADGDTGYGGLLNMRHTVQGYERAGAAAIQIEDQEFPKRCGHTLGRQVIPAEQMMAKIRVARDSRTDPDFLIIARTDARTAHGFEEALARGAAYRDAGADLVFLEALESEDEMAEAVRRLDCPMVANMVEGGLSPFLSQPRLSELGFALAIFPASGFLTSGAALRAAYGALHESGTTDGMRDRLDDFESFSRMVGFQDVWDFERRYGH